MITALGESFQGNFFQDSKRESPQALPFAEYEYVYKPYRWSYSCYYLHNFENYLVTISTGTLKIFATFRMVSICLPVAAAI